MEKVDETNALESNKDPGTDKQTTSTPQEQKVSVEDLKVPESSSSPNTYNEVKEESDKPFEASKEGQTVDEAHLHYEDGVCIYTEPESKCQYTWDEGKQEWIPRDHPSSFSDKDYEYDGETYTYTDKETSIKYKWNTTKNEWETADSKKEGENKLKAEEEDVEEIEDDDGNVKERKKEIIKKQDMTKGHYSFEDDTHVYTDPSDGSKYFWDREKNAWIPKVDDDFLAQYQMSYGFIDNKSEGQKAEEKPEPPPPPEVGNKRKAPQEPAWFDMGEDSTKVYVSGLPLDITENEFLDVMQKCGLVMRELDSGKMKIKLYLDPETSLPKGDALCTYIKKESVELALKLLDGSDLRGHRISVQRAKFTMRGEYNPSLKPKKKRKKDKEKMKKIQEKLFDWRPDKMRGERSSHEKIIIVKNLFSPETFGKDVKLILEYQQDLRDECLKCGAVKKVTLYDSHPEGVAQINFKEVEAADACVQLLNGRWFGKRQITAETWDGKTKYKVSETDEQIKARLAKWEKFLETGKEATAESKTEDKKTEVEKEQLVRSDEDRVETSKKVEEKKDSDVIDRDSDQDTKSSVESEYETDDESKSEKRT